VLDSNATRPDDEDTASSLAGGDELLFAGGGEMGARMRETDWSKTALGPAQRWPQSLKTCVRIILTSRQPMFVWWGPELINLYNDAYKTIVGGKHPEAFTQPASVVWKEIWDQVGPRSRSAMLNNEGTYDEALLLIMERNGYPEETYYTFSYSPVPNEQGGTGGIICANTDDTQRIIGERQLSLLRELGAATSEARTLEVACQRAARALETNPRDLPFALVYLADDTRSHLELVGSAGIDASHVAAPARLSLSEPQSWPVAEALHAQHGIVVDLAGRFAHLPTGAWPSAPQKAAIEPIVASGDTGRAGVLIVGLNPFRLFDAAYEGFVRLAAGQISAAIANAEAYEQERRRAEALAELDRAKTAFFSNVSHEFRTPLTLMLGPLEDAMAAPSRTLSADNLEVAYRNALRLLKLVNALLDFSRIEAGRAQAAYEPTDLATFTADLASAFRSAIERAGLEFRVELGELAEPIHVDRDMWEKIVLNLLSNALKFTFGGHIRVALRDDGAEVRLDVEDSGTGIPAAELGNVFKRFHRVQGSRSRTHEGSGIGLALVSELVRLHGGTIAVQSELGAGTTFTVRIPKGTAHLPRERVGTRRGASSTAGAEPYIEEAQRWLPAEASRGTSAPVELLAPVLPEISDAGTARILLADDNADMRGYLARLLRERWTVDAVADGAEALSTARRSPPDLVLSDVMMPNLDGFGLLAALRAEPGTRSVPFIMLSARAGEESRVEGLEAGADDYLVKPFSARELLARVATHLQLAQLRRAAEQERARLYEVFMQTPVAIAVLTGPELHFEVANAAYAQMVDRSELLGKSLEDAFPELHGNDIVKVLHAVHRTGQPYRASELKVPLVRRGSLRDGFFDVVVQPLLGAAAVSSGVVVVAVDVTEQVLARRKVEALRAAAEDASRAKDEFLSTLSHELRTPLNAIIGWSALLRKGDMTPERTERALETVERNAIVQARLIEDMLDLSRIEQGKLVLSVGPLELVRVVEAAIDAVRPAADAKGVRLQPVLDSHATIVGDADRLQQVVWNLLSNAIKFTSKGGRVLVSLRREHSHVEVSVADTGEGIDAEFLPFVFDRFRQADPSFTRRAGGLGLGLAIVRSLVELHGGTVTAQSQGKGSGATFVVRLPMAPLRSDAPARREPGTDGMPQAKLFECPPELGGLDILVVDDEPETRELLAYLLEQCDVRVSTAASAREALSLLSERRFDVLLSDIGMPETDGYALIREVRALPASQNGAIPALALTAYARSEDRTRVLKAGFHNHLAKPIEPGELLVVMATLVRSFVRR
jgi:signal transduction histidine kinase/DNA-binding response OmpR family regulator